MPIKLKRLNCMCTQWCKLGAEKPYKAIIEIVIRIIIL